MHPPPRPTAPLTRLAGLHCDGPTLRDGLGRAVVLRGANVSGRCKTPPFLPFDDPAAFDPLVRWGMNAIRLLVTWEAIEPERGAYDDAYLARVAALARAAGERGLHVIVDLHQDLFSRALGGSGAPAWATQPSRRRATDRRWFLHYALAPAVRDSFRALWRDEGGIRTALLAAIAHTMTALRDVEAVIGWDLFNEPMAPLREVVPGRFEATALAAFHRDCVALRDRLAPGRLLLLEPTPLAAFGVPSTLPAIAGDDLVFAPHLYDATAFLAGRYLPRASTFPAALARVRRTAATRGWPLLVGEFGVLGSIAGADALVADQCVQLDRACASWTVWHYNPTAVDWNDEDASIVTPQGHERPWTAALVRPYPRCLAADPHATSTVWHSRVDRPWSLAFVATTTAPTELVVPRRWLGTAPLRASVQGARATLDETAGCVRIDADVGAHVRVTLPR